MTVRTGLDSARSHIELKHAGQLVLSIEDQNTWRSIDHGRLQTNSIVASLLLKEAVDQAGNTIPAMNRTHDGRNFTTSIAVERRIRREKIRKSRKIACLASRERLANKLLAFLWLHRER